MAGLAGAPPVATLEQPSAGADSPPSRDRERRRSRSRSRSRSRGRCRGEGARWAAPSGPRSASPPPPPPPPLEPPPAPPPPPAADAGGAGGEGDDEEAMMRLLGFSGFNSTKGKEVDDPNAHLSGMFKKSIRTARQYMNRKGGFNRCALWSSLSLLGALLTLAQASAARGDRPEAEPHMSTASWRYRPHRGSLIGCKRLSVVLVSRSSGTLRARHLALQHVLNLHQLAALDGDDLRSASEARRAHQKDCERTSPSLSTFSRSSSTLRRQYATPSAGVYCRERGA